MRVGIPILCATLIITATCGVSRMNFAPAVSSGHPNVVVVLVDTLRPSYLDLYGYELQTAPFLSRLAEKSAVFDHALSTSSWTAPSVASVFTSLYPFQHGVVQGFFAHQDLRFAQDRAGPAELPLNSIADEITTLPEAFRQAGYATFSIAANRNIDKEMGFTQGFDRAFEENELRAEAVFGKLRTWQREISRKAPYFLYVHLMDPHHPYRRNSPYYEQFRRNVDDDKARYLSEIRYTDQWIERLYRMFRMDRNTILMVLSDHGEEFGDHGSTQHGPFLYDELQRVVMLAYGPRAGIAPQRIAHNVSLLDVFPALTDLAEIRPASHIEGKSLRSLVVESASSADLVNRILLGHRISFARPVVENWSATLGPWKYIEHYGRPPELFNHETDREERANLAAKYPDIARELARKIDDARNAPRRYQGESVRVPLDSNLREQLESIGYVD